MLKRAVVTILLTFITAVSLPSVAAPNDSNNPIYVRLNTTAGSFVLRLRPDQAPITVRNFLHYVKTGFYNGTIFHRVIPGFMIQGGGFTQGMKKKSTDSPIKNESNNDLQNNRGTIAMARTSDPDSATSQFFINLVDNHYLDGQNGRPGYAVFGKVIRGMGVVDSIAKVPTTTKGPYQNVPVTPVVIRSANVISKAKALQNANQ